MSDDDLDIYLAASDGEDIAGSLAFAQRDEHPRQPPNRVAVIVGLVAGLVVLIVGLLIRWR